MNSRKTDDRVAGRTFPFRHWKKSCALLLLLVVFGPYLISRVCAPPNRVQIFTSMHTPQVKSFDGELTIACFNIAHGRGATNDNWQQPGSEKPKRVAEIADFLKVLNADIVVLNEVDFLSTWSGKQNQAAAIAKQAGYPFYAEQRNLDFRVAHFSWRFGNAVLSKYPINAAHEISYPPEKAWEDWVVGCKRGVVCEIQLDELQSIRIAGVHLEHRSESIRLASAKKIAELAQDGGAPFFAAGDFNSTPTGFPQSSKTIDGVNTVDWLIGTGIFQRRPESNPGLAEFTFSSTQPRSVIDWIMIPQSSDQHEFEFLQYRVVETELSDHRAVVSDVQIINEHSD